MYAVCFSVGLLRARSGSQRGARVLSPLPLPVGALPQTYRGSVRGRQGAFIVAGLCACARVAPLSLLCAECAQCPKPRRDDRLGGPNRVVASQPGVCPPVVRLGRPLPFRGGLVVAAGDFRSFVGCRWPAPRVRQRGCARRRWRRRRAGLGCRVACGLARRLYGGVCFVPPPLVSGASLAERRGLLSRRAPCVLAPLCPCGRPGVRVGESGGRLRLASTHRVRECLRFCQAARRSLTRDKFADCELDFLFPPPFVRAREARQTNSQVCVFVFSPHSCVRARRDGCETNGQICLSAPHSCVRARRDATQKCVAKIMIPPIRACARGETGNVANLRNYAGPPIRAHVRGRAGNFANWRLGAKQLPQLKQLFSLRPLAD